MKTFTMMFDGYVIYSPFNFQGSNDTIGYHCECVCRDFDCLINGQVFKDGIKALHQLMYGSDVKIFKYKTNDVVPYWINI